MRNIKKIMLSAVVCAITVMMALISCSLDAGDSSSVELKGKMIIDDVLSIRENGIEITPYFEGTGKYLEVVGEVDYQTAFAFGAGADMTTGKAITLGKDTQYVAFRVTEDDENRDGFYQVEINKKRFSSFSNLTSFVGGDVLPNIVIRKDGSSVYFKKTASAVVRYTFSASNVVTSCPAGATGTELTGTNGTITIPTDNSKYLLVSVWPAGSDPASDAAETGWIEVGGTTVAVMPTCWYGGTSWQHGSNVTVPVGGKITFVVSTDKASALYADWSATSTEPADKSISAYKAETALNGEIKLEITSSNQAVGYLRCWAKGLDGNYSQTFVLTVTPSSTTTQTSTTTPTDTTTTPVVVNTGNFYIDSSFVGVDVQITYEDRAGKPVQRGTVELYTVSVNEKYGKVPLTVNKGEKISVSLIISGQWCDATGNAGWSQSSSWNGNSVTLTSYANGGGMTPNGRSTVWTMR